MRIATFRLGGERTVGIVSADGQSVQPVALDAATAQRGALSLIENPSRLEQIVRSAGSAMAITAVRLEAPLPLPRRNVFCVGRNYHAHAKELSASVFKNNSANPEAWPIVFTKVPECVVGPHDDVLLPAGVSEQIDYESELAIVIGKGGRNISRGDALGHVVGYTIVNDVTARDVQMRHQQWDLGKSFDTFCPMGPWIVTADAVDGTNTRVRGWVNGELRQDGQTTDLIFDIPTLIETCSRGITLYPGGRRSGNQLCRRAQCPGPGAAGQAQGLCSHHGQTHSATAGCADPAGSRRRRLRGFSVAGPACTRRHTERHRRQTEFGNRQADEHAGHQKSAVRRGRRAPPSTPEAMSDYMVKEMDRWGKVVKDIGIKVE